MLRFIAGLLFLTSCSLGVVQTGGEGAYVYDPYHDYQFSELQEISSDFIMTSRRDPPLGTLEQLFKKGENPLKRIGIVIFESQIQPTRGGLAGEDKVYMSEQGKQILTEGLLRIWDEIFKMTGENLDYVTISKIKKSKSLHQFGAPVVDYVNSRRTSLDPDDIFFLDKGKKTTTATILNARGMRDLSFLLVPATELMSGPKWSEHQKQFVNDLSKELNLDAVIVLMSQLSWSAQRVDKHSGEHFDDSIQVNISASTLIPLAKYRDRAIKLGLKDPPSINTCFRTYSTTVKLPVLLSVSKKDMTFSNIEAQLLNPMLKTYRDLSVMMSQRIQSDLRETH
jgi:hypothetical protein